MERGGLIVRGAILPTPREDAEPCERQGPHGGLMGLPLVTLLLVINPRPEGMLERLSRPLHERLPEELRTLEAPVDPGVLATALCDRRNTGIRLERSGRRRAFALFAEGDEEPGGEDGTSAWEGLEQGEIGRALGALGDGGVEVLNSMQGDT